MKIIILALFLCLSLISISLSYSAGEFVHIGKIKFVCSPTNEFCGWGQTSSKKFMRLDKEDRHQLPGNDVTANIEGVDFFSHIDVKVQRKDKKGVPEGTDFTVECGTFEGVGKCKIIEKPQKAFLDVYDKGARQWTVYIN